LVLVPESGDGIQVLKAGVMEIADLYVVNKSDRPGGDRLVQEVQVMLGLRRGSALRNVAPHHSPSQMSDADNAEKLNGYWEPKTLTTIATRGEGIEELIEALDAHRAHLGESGMLEVRRRDRLQRHTREVVGRLLDDMVWRGCGGERMLVRRMDEIVEGSISPYRVAHEIVECLRQGEHTDD
jgi:LAO/AO transport system kinase